MATTHTTTTISDGATFNLTALASAAGTTPSIYTVPTWSTVRRFAPEIRVASKAAANNQSRKTTINFSFPNVKTENGVQVVKSRINATLEWSIPDDIAPGSVVSSTAYDAVSAADLFIHALHDDEIKKALTTGFAV